MGGIGLVINTKPSIEDNEEIFTFLCMRIESSRQDLQQRFNEDNLSGRSGGNFQEFKEFRTVFYSPEDSSLLRY